MKVLVTGSRDLFDEDFIDGVLDRFHEVHPIDLLIDGGAAGADNLARRWATERGIPVSVYPAEWDYYGKAAGPKRNQWMLDFSQPDVVIAFPTTNSRGTWDMVRRAQEAGVEVLIEKWPSV